MNDRIQWIRFNDTKVDKILQIYYKFLDNNRKTLIQKSCHSKYEIN